MSEKIIFEKTLENNKRIYFTEPTHGIFGVEYNYLPSLDESKFISALAGRIFDDYKQLQQSQAENEKIKAEITKFKTKLEQLQTKTPEYESCYHKDQCGKNCPPKKNKRKDCIEEPCLYEEIDKIIEELTNE